MVELYIDGKKADLTTTVSVPMNYELEKLENPTIIKNNFSKTISLEATPNNNNIFSYYYNLTKVHTGIGFCANKRIPFELYRDNDLVETGYLQLNSIKHKNNKYTYEITLYGGLGDFLYNLAYDDEGNEKTLADLNYGYGENDEDFQFKLNSDTIVNAWDNTNSNNLLGGTVNFIPSYNGLYENFDNDKVLINTNGQHCFPESFTQDNTTYSAIGGFGMAELNEELTEFQIRDLRSHKQRSALRLKDFINAICKPKNNGGYTVELDDKYFFNKDNNYYENSWIALPLFNPDSEEWAKAKTDLEVSSNSSLNVKLDYGITNTTINFSDNSKEDLERAGGNSTISIDCDFSLVVNANSTESTLVQAVGGEKPQWSGIAVWLEASVNDIVLGVSDCVVLTKGMQYTEKKGKKIKTTYYKMPTVNDFEYSEKLKTNYIYYDGAFIKTSGNNYEWNGILMDGNDIAYNALSSNTFRLSIKNITNYNNVKYTLKIQKLQSFSMYLKEVVNNPWGGTDDLYVPSPYLYTTKGVAIEPTSITASNIIYPSAILEVNNNKKTLQNVVITKKQLLKNKITPASLLVGFTKLFGLYFVKDAQRKHIKIVTKNTFFENADIIDIDNKVDYSNEVKIEPLMFNKKWYKLVTPALENTKMKTYKADYYEAEYGQKRINTNYNFNTDEEDIYKDNQYQNVITILDSSKYYRNFWHQYTQNNKIANENAPTFGIDGCKYMLWNNGDVEDAGDKEYTYKNILTSPLKPVQFGTLVGADVFPKLCCFDEDNDKQNLNDLNVTLVFYNGMKITQDIDGNDIWYTISDDLPIMESVNDGTPMYLWTNSDYDENGEKICNRVKRLPQFTRYDIELGKILNSFDFGVPFETYIDAEYPEESTLYNKFWKNFYNDQFSENTRKVTAYVRFEDIMLGNHSLSNFYYFNNCYWLLNKIVDYDIANPTRKVKCEFIKINNTANYINGQQVVIPYFELQVDIDAMDDWEVLTNLPLVYGGEFKARFKPYYGIKTIQYSMDGLTQEEVENRVSLVAENDGYYTLTISNVTGDVGLYISGFRETEVVAHYGVNTSVPSIASTKSLQMAVGTNKDIVWTNTLDDSDTMEIKMIDANVIHFRVVPNAYGSTGRMRCGFKLNLSFDDGTTKNLTFATATDSWFTTEFEYWRTLTGFSLEAYDLTVL